MAPRRPLVAGNWKMNGVAADLGEIAAIRDAAGAIAADVVICPPATLISAAAKLCAGSKLALGAQDCHQEPEGAHTGDLSAAMLKDAGAAYVIVGHSERRLDHGETDALVSAKAAAGLGAGLAVILCVGETRAEREAGEALVKVSTQLLRSLPAVLPEPQRLAIAYEPVWAIGTGLTLTAADILEMHAQLRRELAKRLGPNAEPVRILYGGSVKPANAAEILTAPEVDGALVGGASLKAAEFLAIAGIYR
jgi:triosephosphate isomerase (TIM)